MLAVAVRLKQVTMEQIVLFRVVAFQLSRAGGGGGAGGVVYSSSQALTTTGYTVTVGAGGAAVVSMPSNRGNVGSNSSFTKKASTPLLE